MVLRYLVQESMPSIQEQWLRCKDMVYLQEGAEFQGTAFVMGLLVEAYGEGMRGRDERQEGDLNEECWTPSRPSTRERVPALPGTRD